ncbi:MAG: lysophospholipid acyltransferase family protein [Burkholderiaceae bacterium]|nr:lysophospholipid acyltransferase family protein [Burkholderiaceae bacterium]
MSRLVAVGKLLVIVPHIAVGLFTIYGRFPRLSQAQRNSRIEVWAGALLAKLAIKLVVNGTPPSTGPVLLVANHISWLDILVMHAARHCRFVSKSDVKDWPVFGTLATAGGTLYIERESRRDAMRMVHHMSEALTDGHILAVFPEGTTGNGVDLLPFHGNLLEAAVKAQVPVQPVALQFVDEHSGEVSQGPSYVGDETLLGSLWRTLRTPGIVAVVTYGEPQEAAGRDRRAWAADVKGEIERLKA